MRILTVGNRYVPWSLGGYEVVWSQAVRWLRCRGHEVRVLTTVADPSDLPLDGPAPPGVHRELLWYWRDHAFPPIGLRAAGALERANALVLARHLHEFAPQMVSWWGMGGMSLSLLESVRRAGVPAVASVGDEWLSYGPLVDGWMRRWRGAWRPAAGVAERLWKVPTRFDLERAGRWLFTSRYLLDSARSAGWRLADAAVLPHGIDDELFAARAAGPWRWRLAYVGRIDPRKGIGTAVEALARLPAQAVLSIHGAGNEAHRRELAALAERLGVKDRVCFQHGLHAGVPAAYAASDAVVFPVCWREPWGLVPLEAMAVGRPVIASRAGGGPDEYLEEGRNCLRFDVGDADALAAAVLRLAGDQALCAELVANGRRTAARFTAQRFHERLEEVMLGAVHERLERAAGCE